METKKHILVTGGAGYIGSVLTSYLLGKGYRVYAVDCLLDGGGSAILSNSYNGDFAHWGLTVNEMCSRDALHHFDIYAVVHLAALLRPTPGLEQEFKKENSGNTRAIYDAAAKAGIEKFVFASTYFNYGEQPDTILADETTEANPWDAYTESKVEDEQYIFSQMGKPDYTIAPIALRFAQAYGLSPSMRWDLLVNRFVRDAMTEGKIVVFEKDVIRAFVHVYDIARAIEYALRDWPNNRRGWGEIFNVGGEHYTKSEIATLVQQKSPHPVEVEYIDHKAANSMPGTRISFDKIQEKWGWQQHRNVLLSLGAMMRDGEKLGLF